MSSFICSAPVYEYEGWTFNYGMACGLWPVTKRYWEPYKRAGKKFYDMFERFMQEEDQDQFRAGGGCERL